MYFIVFVSEETSNTCAKSTCTKFAVKCAGSYWLRLKIIFIEAYIRFYLIEWEEDYCSYECAVSHCKQVFQTFVKNNLQGS